MNVLVKASGDTKRSTASTSDTPKSDTELAVTAHKNYIETLMYWMHKCISSGDAEWYADVLGQLLGAVLRSCHHQHSECAAVASFTCKLAAWAPVWVVGHPETYLLHSSPSSWSRYLWTALHTCYAPRQWRRRIHPGTCSALFSSF